MLKMKRKVLLSTFSFLLTLKSFDEFRKLDAITHKIIRKLVIN